jgi:hypothetical protein
MINRILNAPLLFLLLLPFPLLLAPAPALAWGSAGHAAVGALADRLIRGSHAQREVAALLAPGESLEQAANWLDCVKGTFCGPQTQEMLDYTLSHPRHGHYHYTDIPFQRAHYRAGGVGSADDDIVHTLRQAITVLQNKAGAVPVAGSASGSALADFTPRQALRLIAHLVGDIHQPLHVGVAYVDRDGHFVLPAVPLDVDGVTMFDTRGGNSLLLAAISPAPRSFHGYWDASAVDAAMRNVRAATPAQFADSLMASVAPPPDRRDRDPANWPVQWADDGLRVAKLAHIGLQPGPRRVQLGRNGEPSNAWALTLPPDYSSLAARLARQQLAKAGYRLAALLQAIWP